MREQRLLKEIRVTAFPPKPEEFSERQTKFYTKYATVAFKTLTNPLFQRFLSWMMVRENIDANTLADVQIRAFPFRKENGNGLAGKFNKKGGIFIYPKRLEFCRKLMHEFEKENVYFYIKVRAMATLIHELLHIKYSHDEEEVRRLTRKYLDIFTHYKNSRSMNDKRILNVLFSQ
jgi:hypothetical protein